MATRGRQTPASRLQGLWARVNDCVHARCCSARPGGGAAGGDGPPRGRRLSGPTPPPPPTRTGAGAGSSPHACSSSDWAVGSGRAAIVSSAPGAVQGSAALRPVQPEAWACVCGALGVGGDLMTAVAPRATRPGEQQPTAPPPCAPVAGALGVQCGGGGPGLALRLSPGPPEQSATGRAGCCLNNGNLFYHNSGEKDQVRQGLGSGESLFLP